MKTYTKMQWALAYASLGWPIFPLRPGAKTPLIKEWQNKATTDQQMIREWWTQYPDANIGVACGPARLVVVDLDVKGDADGIATWQMLAAERGIERDTLESQTPSGGRHLFYAANGEGVRNSAGRLGPGVDVRADGGYIVLPPSTLDGGGSYEWLESANPREKPQAPLPPTLLSLLTDAGHFQSTRQNTSIPVGGDSPYTQSAKHSELRKLAQATEGQRNDQLNRSAFALGQLVGAGSLARSEAEIGLEEVAHAIGLGQKEAQGTIKSGLEAGIRQPRQVSERGVTYTLPDLDVKPFDTSQLSERMRKLLQDGWQPGERHSQRYDRASGGALAVALAMLGKGATSAQTAKALLDSPLTNGDAGLVEWTLGAADKIRHSQEQGQAALSGKLLAILTDAGRGEKESATPLLYRYDNAGRVLMHYLLDRGYLVYDPATYNTYYMDEIECHLYRLDRDSPVWKAWLHRLTGVNPADKAFKALHEVVLTNAQTEGKQVKVVRVAAWDPETKVLRISRFDGAVYRLDGENIVKESNGGGGILFDDDPMWQPYKPNLEPAVEHQLGEGTALAWTLKELPNWSSDAESSTLILRSWWLSVFFPELLPTKPVLVMLGEKGSGKSMVLRVLLQMLLGSHGQVSGVPDKPDGFTAAAAATHVLVLDNVDNLTTWLQDKIARITTGAVDQYRRLYTSNELGRVIYRCYLAVTARTPDTLKRDDLADRLLLLPVLRVENPEPERTILGKVHALRNAWWGDLLTALNEVVAIIRSDGLPVQAQLRMADFDSFAQVVARAGGEVDVWERTVKSLQGAQQEFILEDEPLVPALTKWLEDTNNIGREIIARDLYAELTRAMFGDTKPNGWYPSPASFGKKLANIRRELRFLFRVEGEKPTTGPNKNVLVYRFWPLDSGRDGGLEPASSQSYSGGGTCQEKEL